MTEQLSPYTGQAKSLSSRCKASPADIIEALGSHGNALPPKAEHVVGRHRAKVRFRGDNDLPMVVSVSMSRAHTPE